MTQQEIEESEWAENELAAMKQKSEPPVAGSAICSACGQTIKEEIKPLYYSYIYRAVNGRLWARCPNCLYNMKPKQHILGHAFRCERCNLLWKLVE